MKSLRGKCRRPGGKPNPDLIDLGALIPNKPRPKPARKKGRRKGWKAGRRTGPVLKPFRGDYSRGVVPYGSNEGRAVADLSDGELAGCHGVALQRGPQEYVADLKDALAGRRGPAVDREFAAVVRGS